MDNNNSEKINSGSEIKTIGSRIGAVIIDLLIVFPITLWILFGFIKFGFLEPGAYALLSWGIILLLSIFFYSFLLEGAKGQTLGKMAMNIIVVKESGNRCTYKASFLRNLLRIIPDSLFFYLIGLISIVLSEKNQRLGDHLANTIVAKKK